MVRVKVPNLFFIGTARTGSTSLYHYFKQHPDIFVSKKKELHFFSRNVMAEANKNNITKFKQFVLDIEHYLEYFKGVKEEKVIVDISPGDSMSPDAAREIYEFNPNAKIIFSVREPVDAMYSLHSALVNRAFLENERDFIKAVYNNRNKKDFWIHKDFYFNRVNYYNRFKPFIDVFPREQLFFYFYSEIRDNPNEVYKNILNFLELPYIPPKNFEKYAVNRTLRFPLLVKIAETLMSKYDLTFLSKSKIAKELASLYFKTVTKPTKREKLTSEVTERLKKDLVDSVMAFEHLLKDNSFVDSNFNLRQFWNY